jgi:enediyne biosynthesis protein E4
LIASQNRGRLEVFRHKTTTDGFKSFSPSPETMAILIELENGKKERIETSYGAGFLSQSSRSFVIPANTKSITMIDYKGNKTPFIIPN